MFDANIDMIDRVMRGMGPDKQSVDRALGARVVMNIPAVHVPSFCSQKYKNAYDLGNLSDQAAVPSGGKVPRRYAVDKALTTLTNTSATDIYFGALELNGTGVRFYGDLCLVLNDREIPGNTVVLESNSYDLVRPPLAKFSDASTPATLAAHARDMHGRWDADMHVIATLKVIERHNPTLRRFTTGQISESVLNDEDYIEVLKIGSFDKDKLQEVRLSAADAAAESQIGERLRLGPTPSLAELQWRKHRRAAIKALRKHRVASRIVTTSGRVRQ